MPKKNKEPKAKPGLGATYQGAKLVAQLAAPAYPVVVNREPATRALDVVKTRQFQKGAIVALVDQWGSKKLGHAAALSRKSVTAWAPEFDAVALSAIDTALEPENAYRDFEIKTTGFNPQTAGFAITDQTKRQYLLKYGLGLGRKLVNKTRLMEPVKKALSMMGVTL